MYYTIRFQEMQYLKKIIENPIDTYRIRAKMRLSGGDAMKDNYTYPVIVDYSEEGETQLFFPAFEDGYHSIVRGDDPVQAAQNWLALNIAELEDEGLEVPAESRAEIDLKEGQKLIYVNVWMPYHRSREKVTYVKKTLTIPAWLDILAKESNINFSETLTEALKAKLQIKN